MTESLQRGWKSSALQRLYFFRKQEISDPYIRLRNVLCNSAGGHLHSFYHKRGCCASSGSHQEQFKNNLFVYAHTIPEQKNSPALYRNAEGKTVLHYMEMQVRDWKISIQGVECVKQKILVKYLILIGILILFAGATWYFTNASAQPQDNAVLVRAEEDRSLLTAEKTAAPLMPGQEAGLLTAEKPAVPLMPGQEAGSLTAEKAVVRPVLENGTRLLMAEENRFTGSDEERNPEKEEKRNMEIRTGFGMEGADI